MTNGPTYHSDEELIKRLQIVMRDAAAGSASFTRDETNIREVRNLVAELAERIWDDPARWGIADIPDEFRDDAAADALTALLLAIPEFRGRQAISDWYGSNVEAQFRRLWAMSEQQAAERERRQSEPKKEEEPEKKSDRAGNIFEGEGGVWQRFEQEFARDAFALRLRYMLKRTPEEMTVMLDAPSTRAITMRLNRARDRFRMFCEQSGVDRTATAEIMTQLAEERS